MATGDNTATFESWLNQATDPNNEQDRWDCIQSFYQLVDQETDGPQVAIRLLAHKIQSPQEKESLQALTVLEACMNNCGKRFHSEAAKFRFLNELIKLLTPKKDPKLPDTLIMVPPTQRNKESVFDQEDKATLLARLLKSARPEDLETANRLIKSTIQEEQEKAEKVTKRESALQDALYERCDRLRPSLFRLASETMDEDVAMVQILAANDELTLVVNDYKNKVGKESVTAEEKEAEVSTKWSGKIMVGLICSPFFIVSVPVDISLTLCLALLVFEPPKSPREIKSYHLIDLSALDSPQTHRKADSPPSFESSSPMFSSFLESSFNSDADQDFNEPERRQRRRSESPWMWGQQRNIEWDEHLVAPSPSTFTESGSLSENQKQLSEMSGSPEKKESLLTPQLLKNIFVPVHTIKPSNLEPITVYDHGGVHVSLHFARDSPLGYPGVAVVVSSTVNTSALQVKDFLFQAAVPKTMLVKLQPASGTHLPPYNPLLPPPAVSQVLLLDNPQKRKVRLRYKLTMTHGDQHLNETGEIDNFPDWTSLIRH
ncbi:hypothetical protein F7725_005954 [Dissostichus mawsoni]|uniref:Uncharacterized protein n=1 Tax=Dissostichus mawsoni TaxID=36200 RepID=A0A7J5YV33_DISMA|nr:hypothetical protein F7725_005954 [Dissostichus mawsoni]